MISLLCSNSNQYTLFVLYNEKTNKMTDIFEDINELMIELDNSNFKRYSIGLYNLYQDGFTELIKKEYLNSELIRNAHPELFL